MDLDPVGKAVLVLVLSVIAWPGSAGAAGAEDCRTIEVRESASGDVVVGIEDVIVDTTRGRLWLSAHDRSVRDQSGGIYALPIEGLKNGADVVSLPNAVLPHVDEPFRPHGIAISPSGRRLFVIDQGRTSGGGTSILRVIDLTEEGDVDAVRTVEDPRLCRANDVLAIDEHEVLISRERGSCGKVSGWFETVLGLERGEVVRVRVEDPVGGVGSVADGIFFANGLNRDLDGTVWVAASRGKELISIGSDGGTEDRIPLPGGPDNISRMPDGRLLVAVHPSLLRLAGAFSLGVDRITPGSRITAVDTRTHEVDILFEDDDGSLFSAATTAIATNGHLVAGSVIDAGLLACRYRSVDEASASRNQAIASRTVSSSGRGTNPSSVRAREPSKPGVASASLTPSSGP